MQRHIQDTDLPALMGIDPNRSAWTLYHILLGNYDPQKEPVRKSVSHALAAPLLEHYLREGAFGPGAEPAGALQTPLTGTAEAAAGSHGPLLEVHPHVRIPASEATKACGPGDGIGFAALVSPEEWQFRWVALARATLSPIWELRAQTALFAAHREQIECNWALVIPHVGLDQQKAPLATRRDPAIGKQIFAALSDFADKLRKGEEPPASWRADRDTLLAIAARSGVPEEGSAPEISEEDGERFALACATRQALLQKIGGLQTQIADLRRELEEPNMVITESIRSFGRGGRLEYKDTTAAISIEERPERKLRSRETTRISIHESTL